MENTRASTLRLWLDFIWEERFAILLYGVTVFFFMIVGWLYQIEDLSGLFYAAPLSAFFWVLVGFVQGKRYVSKRRILALLEWNTEQIESVGNIWEQDTREPLEKAYVGLVEKLEQEKRKQCSLAEEHRTAQNDYYLMWAHQIKTPISAIKLLLGGLESTGVRETFLLKEELFKIEQYVEMALYFQRLQSMESDLVLGEYDLHTLLKQAVRKYSVLFINKGVSLKLQEMSFPILTDEKWFSFCIEQILSNCIKYTVGRAGVICIYLSEDEPDTLVVEDNGIGIRAEDLPRIFERGFTGYNGRMDKKSTGIGLYLCKQVLDRLGNTIRVESGENAGTKVYLTLYQRREQPM